MNDSTPHTNGLRHEIFDAGILPAAGEVEPAPDRRTANWFRASRAGFHQKPYTTAEAARLAGSYRVDGRRLLGVYDDEAPAPSLDPGIPVATFAEFTKTLNTGVGRMLDSHLITMVTVRPSHRRRGILRAMMTDSLERALAAGLPMAALTATEGTIYGRFGFGPATTVDTVKVDVKGGLNVVAAPEGTVITVDPAALRELAPSLFEEFHATHRGSMGRQEAYTLRATGRLAPESPTDDPTLRAAVYLDAEGVARGFLTYAFAGWDTTPPTMEVRDLVATNAAARRELWRYLGAHDLIERVVYDSAAPDDPLPWSLDDPRKVAVTETEDLLWLRILDVPAALASREYATDGSLRLRITDPQGYTTGNYHLVVEGGAGSVQVETDPDEPSDLELDIGLLGSLYLGGTGVRTLAAAGRVLARNEDAVDRAARLLDLGRAPYTINSF